MVVRERHATTPCRTCGEAIVIVSAVQPDGSHRTVALDPVAPVFMRETEPETGRSFWIELGAPSGEARQTLARHRCRGSAAKGEG